jgi:predicted secreted protein
MKYYKKDDEVFAFENDGSQDEYITQDMVKMTDDEVDRHVNPEKYLSDIEKAQLNRERMPQLTPIEFDIKLNNAGLYDTVQELIKDKFELRIAYNRATFFSRTDPFIDQARIALGLTDEQVDMIWESSLV